MSDGNASQDTGTPAPAVVTASNPNPPAPQPTAAPAASAHDATAEPAPPPTPTDPHWLTSRIDRAKQSGSNELLKQLGVPDLATAKAAVDAAKAAEESKKSAEQRAAELANKATAAEQANTRAQSLIREQASRMLMVLTPEQQKAVTDFAGDDPAEQLRFIHSAAPLWSKDSATPAATTENKPAPASAGATSAPPVNTAPPPAAPPGSGPGSPPDHRAVYQSLQRTNPFAAAAYGLQNLSAVHIPKS